MSCIERNYSLAWFSLLFLEKNTPFQYRWTMRRLSGWKWECFYWLLFVSMHFLFISYVFLIVMVDILDQQETLSHSSNYLAATTLKLAKESHRRQVIDFVKACISFNEATIPSISSLSKRLNLFLETAEVSI